jgi:Phosphoribosylaminoimidazolesuccinocarboxamide (SAICAR) synthase
MARRTKIYEGKAKILYEGPEPGTIVQYFKDDATAFNAQKKDVIEGKGVLNNRLSEFFMTGLNQIGVPTHFIKRLNMREQLVRQCEIIPLEVIVRNFAAGTMAKRLGDRGRAAAAAPDRRILLQGRQAGRSAGHRGTYRGLWLGQPAGHGRYPEPRPAGE